MTNITCKDCGTLRRNVQYKNTLTCESCRLLRDLEWIADRTHNCTAAGCNHVFAPARRGDRWCGECSFSNVAGTCVLCKTEDAELYRPSIPVCLRCVKSPDQRTTLVQALRRGRAARKEANHG